MLGKLARLILFEVIRDCMEYIFGAFHCLHENSRIKKNLNKHMKYTCIWVFFLFLKKKSTLIGIKCRHICKFRGVEIIYLTTSE